MGTAMGNKLQSHIEDGIKEQATANTGMYNLTDLNGGGELVELMKKANRTKNFKSLDDKIQSNIKQYLYNDGKGQLFHVSDLVKERLNLERTGYKEVKGGANSDYKLVCWRLEERGCVGETPLHVCLLNATSVHADLAKRLLHFYPHLINDIYSKDEYYGENALHMAIVNEDPSMVKFLLDHNADYGQRACGKFFTAWDQKNSRHSTLEHEHYDLAMVTNYEGQPYWGEYPLGFAACLGQEECVRLLIAKGTDTNLQDTNGNTALHMLVINDNKHITSALNEQSNVIKCFKDMFDLLVSLGASLNIMNRQQLTPLTLAAKLGRKDMYEHILEKERDVFWTFGDVTCASYPLKDIDTVAPDGSINVNSAMYHIIYGAMPAHLDMLDGVVSHVLQAKWKTFVKSRFYLRFLMFIVYFLVFTLSVFLRPGTDLYPQKMQIERTNYNGSTYMVNSTVKDSCHLLKIHKDEDKVRLIMEVITVCGSCIYILLAIKEIRNQGLDIFFFTLCKSPGKLLFTISNILVIAMLPGRAACAVVYEDVVSICAILCTAPYFLFFCRGIKLVGPFVYMIYKMVRTDLVRFFVIYLVFLIGFSQSMFIMFRGVESNIFNDPIEACIGMFMMSLVTGIPTIIKHFTGEFEDMYDSFARTTFPAVPKAIFILYMVMVALLMINMLIAMMANTCTAVTEMQKAWLRQVVLRLRKSSARSDPVNTYSWAMIILDIEQSVNTRQRVKEQHKYSSSVQSDKGLAIIIRWHQTPAEKAELLRLRTLHKAKLRAEIMRKRGISIKKLDVEALDIDDIRKGHVNV